MSKHFFIRYHSRPRLGDEELVELVDIKTNAAVSEPMTRGAAEMERKRRETIVDDALARAKFGDPDAASATGMQGWLAGLNFPPCPYWLELRHEDGLYDVLTKPCGDLVAQGVPLEEAQRLNAQHMGQPEPKP